LKSVSGIKTFVFELISRFFEFKISWTNEGNDYEESTPSKLKERITDFNRLSFKTLNLTRISGVSTLEASSSFLATFVKESLILF
jgi:hypothetical protein